MTNEGLVIAVSLCSAFAFALSTSLKHASATQLADEHGARSGALIRFIRDTLKHPLWLGGIVADVLGLSLQIVALHFGPLAVVQPVLVTGLLFALILRQRSRHDASRSEIVWGIVLTIALAGFLLVSGTTNPDHPHGAYHGPAVAAAVIGFVLAGVCVALGRRQRSGGRSAALLGIAVGVTYAASAAVLKAVTNVALRGPEALFTSWQLYAVIVLGVTGLLLNQIAFRAGPLTASLPAIATVDPLLSIAIGVVVYDEHIKHGPISGPGLVALFVLMGAAAIQLTRAGKYATPDEVVATGTTHPAPLA